MSDLLNKFNNEDDETAQDVAAILGAPLLNNDGTKVQAPTPEVESKVVETASDKTLEIVYATRRGGGMTLPLTVGDEGTFLVDFKNGTATLKGRAALAMREEYKRNEHLRRLITEVSATDRDTIETLNRQAKMETMQAHRGVGSASMGRMENAQHQAQMNRTQTISDLTNKSSGSLPQLGS